MKKYILLIVFISMCFQVIGQSNIRLNNYWANTLNINPAAIYDKYVASFSVAANQHWVGFPGAPLTFFCSATTYLEDYHTQLGLKLVQDKIGYTSTTNINLTYGYAIMFQRDWQLHLGVGGNYQRMSYDLSQVQLASDTDSEAYQYLLSQDNVNADIGMEVTSRSLRFGAASQNIFSLFSPETNRVQTNTNFIYAKYRQFTNSIVNLGAGACYVQYSNMYQMEFNLTSYFKFSRHSGLIEQPDLFDLGIYYRTRSEVGLILGFNLSEALHVSYSYDFNVSGIRRSSYGTNELMITYNLTKKPVCRNCWY